jgi:hypothetical protein
MRPVPSVASSRIVWVNFNEYLIIHELENKLQQRHCNCNVAQLYVDVTALAKLQVAYSEDGKQHSGKALAQHLYRQYTMGCVLPI